MTLKHARHLVIFFTVAIGLFLVIKTVIQPMFSDPHTQQTQAATIFNSSKPLPEFELTKTNGEPFTQRSFRGQWTVLFFGYRQCPDICPMTLSVMRTIWNSFPEKQIPMKFVFASIKKEADDLEALSAFLNNYHHTFQGITGTMAEMDKLKAPLGVFANEVIDESGNEIIDHSASLMIINPKGQLHAVFTPPFNIEAVASDLALLSRG